MTVRFSPSRASFRRAAILALAVTLVPLPLAAAEKAAPAQAPAQPLRTSIAKHAAREALVTSTRRTPQNAAPQNSARPRAQSNNPQSTGFFRSPAGIACLAVIAVGTGYALYSASNDRIHSVVRDGQK